MTSNQKLLLQTIAGRGRREQEKAYFFPDLYSNRHVLSKYTINWYKEFDNNLRRGKIAEKH